MNGTNYENNNNNNNNSLAYSYKSIASQRARLSPVVERQAKIRLPVQVQIFLLKFDKLSEYCVFQSKVVGSMKRDSTVNLAKVVCLVKEPVEEEEPGSEPIVRKSLERTCSQARRTTCGSSCPIVPSLLVHVLHFKDFNAALSVSFALSSN